MSVVVPTYKRPDRIVPLLEALDRQSIDHAAFEVIVVDNCSQDDSADLVRSYSQRTGYSLRLLQTAVNRGPAPARNLGWKHALAPCVAYLDDDCIPEPEWLDRGMAALDADATLGVMQGKTLPPRPITRREQEDHFVWRGIERATPYFEACNIFYRRAALEATGGFDEDIGFWGEDTSAGWKVVEAGWARGFADDAVVVHPVEHRGLRWFIDTGMLDTNIVRLAKMHPGFRREAFWAPWAYRREDAAFVLALAGLAGGWKWRTSLLATVPYLWWRRPSVRRPTFFRLCVEFPLIDAARLLGQVRGMARYRILVL